MRPAVNSDRQTVAKNGRFNTWVEVVVGLASIGVSASRLDSVAWIEMDPWTEKDRCIGSVFLPC